MPPLKGARVLVVRWYLVQQEGNNTDRQHEKISNIKLELLFYCKCVSAWLVFVFAHLVRPKTPPPAAKARLSTRTRNWFLPQF
jgi:hypothetical protein